jgi:hypothetical protein
MLDLRFSQQIGKYLDLKYHKVGGCVEVVARKRFVNVLRRLPQQVRQLIGVAERM